jgi:hypothetical protein
MLKQQYNNQNLMDADHMDADGGMGEDLQGLMPARAAALPAEAAPSALGSGIAGLPAGAASAMGAGIGSGLSSSAPAADAPKPTDAMLRGKEMSQTQFEGMEPMYGPERRGEKGPFLGYGFKHSQIKNPGMTPVYEQISNPRSNVVTQGKLLGYKQDPSQGKIDVPKPDAIVAAEKKFGTKMDPIYATEEGRHGSTIEYGPPIGYRFDNGNSQYVNFDESGKYQSTQDRNSSLLPILGILAMPFLGPLAFEAMGLGAGAAGAGALGAEALGAGALGAGAAFTPEMIAAGLTPGSIGALGAASGALTGAELAAASGIGSLGAGAAGAAGLGASTPITETAAETLGNTVSGAGGYGSGAANPSLLSSAGAGEAGITSLAAPITETVGEIAGSGTLGAGGYGTGSSLLGAEGTTAALGSGAATGAAGAEGLAGTTGAMSGGFGAGVEGAGAGIGTASHLTPAALESLMGTAGYGVNASALEASAALGVPAAQVGAGAGSAFPGVTPTMPKLTPAQLESLAGTPGYGKSAAALAAATAAGIDPNIVGSGSDLPFPGVNPSTGITDLLKKAKDKLLGSSDSGSGSGLGGTLGLLALMSMMNKGGGAAPASTATIPELTATRSQLPYDVDKKGVNPNTPYRPGQGGVTYFSPTTYTPKAAGGGLMSLGGYSDGGRLLQGPGDGVSDSIPAIIGRKQPARLANGEFVIPARIVSELGNGSTDAGAKRLYEMMDRVQRVRRKTKNVAANTKAAKYLPA